MSISQLFEISRRSLRTSQAGMKAAGQNIANAGTEGYHRRRVALQAENTVAPGLYAPPGANTATGNGVSAASYERVRDRMLDGAAAEAQSGQGSAREEARLLTALEGTLATGTDAALPSAMEGFWDSWNDVANNPTDRGVRSALLSQADTLTSAFKSVGQGVARLKGETQATLAGNVESINGKLGEMATLNQTIREARSSGSPDLVAEDRRDTLVKELSAQVPARVQEDAEAGYTLTVNGMSVVQGDEHTPLTLASPEEGGAAGDRSAEVQFGDTGVAFDPGAEGGGTLGAQVRTLNETLPGVQGRLDDLAAQVAQKVNDAHRGGFDQEGNTDASFFEGDTAATLKRAVETPDDVAALAAPDTPGNPAPARAAAALSEELTPGAIDLGASVGAEVERASAQEAAQTARVEHLEGMARGVSGVSVDEEMTRLIEHQQSFAASARVLNTAQSVMDTLLSL